MQFTFNKLIKKVLLLSGAIVIGWGAYAQSTDQINAGAPAAADSTHHMGMNHHWGPGPRRMNDSTGRRNWSGRGQQGPGWGRGEGGRDWAGRGFQRHGHEGRGWAHRGPRIHYTADQRKQIVAIEKDYRQQREDLFKKDNITLKEYKAGLVALQKDKKGKMAALLTPQQKDELMKHKKEADENRQVAEAARMERLKLRLSLTDEQVTKIKAGQEQLRSQAAAIHENDNLLPEQKMQQMKDLMAKRKDVFKSVLSPEQYTKFEQMMQHRRGPGHEGFGGPGFGGPRA